jgi:hypothetical protein
MRFDSAFAFTAASADLVEFEHLAKRLDEEWIVQALEATGTATIRRRRLPAEQVIWVVIGMALMRDRPIADIVRQLDLALPDGKRRTVFRCRVIEYKRDGARRRRDRCTAAADRLHRVAARNP